MDLDKFIKLLEKRKETTRQHYMRKHGLQELTEEQKELQMLERVRKKQESYERQTARQRQMRHDSGLKPLGRPHGLRYMPLQDATASCGGRPIKNSNETTLENID